VDSIATGKRSYHKLGLQGAGIEGGLCDWVCAWIRPSGIRRKKAGRDDHSWREDTH